MNEFRQLSTQRLVLRTIRAKDSNQVYWLNSDPRAWAHRPSDAHTSRVQTETQVAAYIAAWERDGLGCWTARTHDGTFLGIGGCSVKGGVGWNLYYRFLPEAQGRGYEAELVLAAIIAAGVVRPELPVVALVLERNAPARDVAEHAGLAEVWRSPDDGSEDPGAARLVYADRELPAGAIETLRVHSQPRPRPADPAREQARADPSPGPPVPQEPPGGTSTRVPDGQSQPDDAGAASPDCSPLVPDQSSASQAWPDQEVPAPDSPGRRRRWAWVTRGT